MSNGPIDPEVMPAASFNGSYVPVQQQKDVTTEMAIARQAQEVQAAMVIAKRFPRDEYEAYNRIMKACERSSLAETAEYSFPRGGEKVTGPTIRLAEALARNWGNIDFGMMEMEQRNGESTMMAYAWDLETNTRQTRIFQLKHERKTKARGITKLDDPRDIYELTANQGARRLRSCILGIIPGDVVDASIAKCRDTLAKGNGKPLEDRIREMVVAFDKLGVSKDMLERYVGYASEHFTEKDIRELIPVFNALKDGMAKREDYFDIPRPASQTEQDFQQARQQTTELPKEKKGKKDKEPIENGGDSGDDSDQGQLL